jgi:hypothetical protein
MFKSNEPVTNGITDGVEARRMRGMEIAAMARIEKKDGFYIVPSQTAVRQTRYKVNVKDRLWQWEKEHGEVRVSSRIRSPERGFGLVVV